MIIEFVGLPRAGKTTLIDNYFSDEFIIHREAFDLVPHSISEYHQYNLWYAKYVAAELKKALTDGKNHVFDRGVFDRFVFAQALFEDGKLTKDELDDQQKHLKELFSSVNEVVFCDVSVDDSINRDSTPNPMTGERKFLEKLRNNYLDLEKHTKIIKVPTNSSVRERSEEHTSEL